MATRTFILSDAQTAVLRQAYERTKDGPSRTRSQAVRLYGMSYPVPQVQEITVGVTQLPGSEPIQPKSGWARTGRVGALSG